MAAVALIGRGSGSGRGSGKKGEGWVNGDRLSARYPLEMLPTTAAPALPVPRVMAREPAPWPGLPGGLRRAVLYQAIIVAAGLAVFGPAVRNGFTDWDDDIYVTRNPLIADATAAGVLRILTTFHACNYHPLTYLSYMAEHALVGLDPWLYHLDSVLLHVGASVLAFLLARRWLSSEPGAFLTALLFLLHPLRVESVAWVAERKDVLCGLFYLASLLAYTRHLDTGSIRDRRASLLLFVLALLSKVMAITLPAVLVLLVVARREPLRRRIPELIPFAALGLLFAVIGVLAQASSGAIHGLHGGSLPRHVATVLEAVAFYASKLVVPALLSPRYVVEPSSGLLDAGALAGTALLAALVVASIASFRRDRTVLLGVGFFLITWAPVSGLVPSSTVVADRYLYIPAFGLFLAVAGPLAARAFRPAAPGLGAARLGAAALLAFTAVLGVAAALRVGDWRDGLTLWTSALAENPSNPYAHNQLFLAHYRDGRIPEAEEAARKSVALGLGEPRHAFNLCLVYRELGEKGKELEAAQAILRTDPEFVPAWLVVLRHEREAGGLDGCEKTLESLLEKAPADAGLWGARAELLVARGRSEDALFAYLRSIELRPGDPEVLLGTAATLMALGDGERALDLTARSLGLSGPYLHAGPGERLRLVVTEAERSGNAGWIERARTLVRTGKE